MIETLVPRVPERQAPAPDHASLLEQLATLRRENTALWAENAALRVENAALHERVQELEARLDQTSRGRGPGLAASGGGVTAAGSVGHRVPDGGAALCRELSKWWAMLSTCARFAGVEPTNEEPRSHRSSRHRRGADRLRSLFLGE